MTGRNGLDRASLEAKLGSRARGSWCFELNEWLALYLEDQGFSVRRLMARNLYAPGRRQPDSHPLAEPDHWDLLTRVAGAWKDLYQFTLETTTAADFAVNNHFHLTNPSSSFADARFATKPIPGGPITHADRTLKLWANTADGEVLEEERILTTRGQWVEVLQERYGIRLFAAAIDRLWNLEPAVSRVHPRQNLDMLRID